MNWRAIVRTVCVELGWTPAQVGTLTLYTLKMMMASEEDLSGKRKIKAGDYRAAGGDVRRAVSFSAARRQAEAEADRDRHAGADAG